ncbi:hypothetical protein VT84_19555 [Gemmata sp. SH-PL17]|uniref:hypothetical protein n=1 Tax=Gemmata sp. SH-PL17 TaxID=1630693 RepID=UPI00078CDB06|nr:hypothetical protein [Gemmata sp. SH-PL17]AMV26604.1 hypothetical protein VT84_19555 [Gemmata sp. SH-PL17]
MLTSLVLSMTLAAPVPAPAPPVPAGPAPRILELKADADGKIMVVVTRTEKLQPPGAAVNPNGAVPVVARAKSVELGEVKDLTVTTADGKKLDTEEAIKKLVKGGTVVVSADGKPVSPTFLKMFKDDVLVLASPELMGGALPGKPLPGGVRPPIQIQPVAPGIQIQPAVIQIQVAPALPAPVPAVPVK